MLSSYNLEYGYCELRSPPFYPSLVDYSTALVLIGSIARATTLLKLANTSKNRKIVMLSKENGFIIILFIYIELHVQILFDYLPTYPKLFCSKIGILSCEISR